MGGCVGCSLGFGGVSVGCSLFLTADDDLLFLTVDDDDGARQGTPSVSPTRVVEGAGMSIAIISWINTQPDIYRLGARPARPERPGTNIVIRATAPAWAIRGSRIPDLSFYSW